MSLAPFPWPRWIAHRGAGRLAPENTLAAFRLGASHGYSAYECDVKLSADDVPFLLGLGGDPRERRHFWSRWRHEHPGPARKVARLFRAIFS